VHRQADHPRRSCGHGNLDRRDRRPAGAGGNRRVHRVRLGAGDVRASGITNGSDGATWFTEFAATKIGRITTSGAITTFDVPSTSDLPRIAAANDGNLWFTELGAGKIGRIDPSAADPGASLIEFATPAGSSPTNLTTGPDGAVWFVADTKVDRMTTAGAVTEQFDVAAAGDGVQLITTGSDGNLGCPDRLPAPAGRQCPDHADHGTRWRHLVHRI